MVFFQNHVKFVLLSKINGIQLIILHIIINCFVSGYYLKINKFIMKIRTIVELKSKLYNTMKISIINNGKMII